MVIKAANDELIKKRIKDLEDEVSVLPHLKEELHIARVERENKETQIETIFSSAHAMAMEAQIARIELRKRRLPA